MRKRLVRNRKGISPVFAAIYLTILIVVLTSTLFFAIQTYGVAMAEKMKIEEEKQQEAVGLTGPGALNLTSDKLFVESIKVVNEGAITIRIRGLYVGGEFECDPSRLLGDSYVNPKDYIWILLYPAARIDWDQEALEASWTVTTERGTRAHEIGSRLIYGDTTDQNNPMRFYIGPLMIMFDMFQWRSGNAQWQSLGSQNGWSIPKNTPDVTWRILLSNIDTRNIEVTDRSSFTLISNDNSPSAPVAWYIDPTQTTMLFKPGSFYFIYYRWDRPYSDSGVQTQSANVFGESTTCTNFLMFLGSFIDPNGTKTSFGQTIPFEAVIVTGENMPSSLKLTANPENIPNDGAATSILTVTVKDGRGNPIANEWVDFYTTAGTLSAGHATTDSSGIATVILTSTTLRTTADVAALCRGLEGTVKVSFTPAAKIVIAADPPTMPRTGGTSTITIQLRDAADSIVAQSGIQIMVTVAGPVPKSKLPKLVYREQIGPELVLLTDSEGKIDLILKSGTGTGIFTVKAESSGLTPGSVNVEIKS